jgi:hypothetical protein
MVPLLLRNAYGSPVPGRSYFAFNYGDVVAGAKGSGEGLTM